jgi:uncharacterized iron-regulated membrane protein
MLWARVHRWLALALVGLLVIWSVTGLLFHLKPGWDRAYEMLSAERPLSTTGVAPIATIAATFSSPVERVELFDTVLGPVYRVATAGGTELVSAVGAQRLSPLTGDDAKALAKDAVSRSAAPAAYGDVAEVTIEKTVVHVRFTGGITVDVGRSSARLSQRGADTDRIDWLYRIHYLQFTGDKTIDKVIAIAGLVLIWLVIIAGLVLFAKRWRQ